MLVSNSMGIFSPNKWYWKKINIMFNQISIDLLYYHRVSLASDFFCVIFSFNSLYTQCHVKWDNKTKTKNIKSHFFSIWMCSPCACVRFFGRIAGPDMYVYFSPYAFLLFLFTNIVFVCLFVFYSFRFTTRTPEHFQPQFLNYILILAYKSICLS